MNVYVLVEGEWTEKILYRAWLGQALPALVEVTTARDLRHDNFYILSGFGYPSYLRRIRDSHKDIKDNALVDHFLLCVDSEDLTYDAKRAELETEIRKSERETGVRDSNPRFRSNVIVAHCCMETWLLGHEAMMPVAPRMEPLKSYAAFHDVRLVDPETMGCHAEFRTRARFHHAYLVEMIRAGGIRYTKRDPRPAGARDYYEALLARSEKGHIASFRSLVEVLELLGRELEPER